ncbi:hypothetical protein AAFF_G00014260 [Aldrovandia affinis]|uniref:Uncharacterized protein n=1 Tax=Aldrovandia affinis TaxID=143900 RepID=A0AAD7S6B0_9TELE|nr:hypothetical protein AAFF_G00014260 [Aldrovandia affinis]
MMAVLHLGIESATSESQARVPNHYTTLQLNHSRQPLTIIKSTRDCKAAKERKAINGAEYVDKKQCWKCKILKGYINMRQCQVDVLGILLLTLCGLGTHTLRPPRVWKEGIRSLGVL